MKKKLFAILLSLCMVITMMPVATGVAWAEDTIQMYEVWWPSDSTQDEPKIKDGKISASMVAEPPTDGSEISTDEYHYSESIELMEDEGYWVEYFCYKDTDDNFVILNGTPTDTENKITFMSEAEAMNDSNAIGWEIDWSKASVNDSGTITITQDSKTYSMSYEVTGEMQSGGDSENDNSIKIANNDLLVCKSTDGNTFTPIKVSTNNENGIEAPAQYVLPDSNEGTFYVLFAQDAGNLEELGELKLYELDNYQELNDKSTFNITKLDKIGTISERTYNVWKVTVPSDTTDATRIGFAFEKDEEAPRLVKYTLDDESAENPRYYVKYMWIAGTDYDAQYAENTLSQSDNIDRIIPCEENIINENSFSDWDSFYSSPDVLGNSEVKDRMTEMVNLSTAAGDNCVYILHPQGTTLQVQSWLEEAYQQGYSGIGNDHYGGDLFKKLDSDEVFKIEQVKNGNDAKTIDIGSDAMVISKVSLKKFLGTQDILATFTINANTTGTDYSSQAATVRFRMGMNLTIQSDDIASATEANNIVTVIDNASYTQGLMGIKQSHTKMDFAGSDNTYSAYFDYACSEVGEAGQARYATLAVNLADGYVVEKITDKGGNDLGYEVLRNFCYELHNEKDEAVTDTPTINEMGWSEDGCSTIGNYDDATNQDIQYMHVHHCIGVKVVDSSMRDINHETVDSSNEDILLNYLDEHQDYSVKAKSDWWTTYTVFYNQTSEAGNEIIFHIKKATAGDSIAATNNGNSVNDENFDCKDDENLSTAEQNALASNLDTLEAVNDGTYRVAQAYEMTVTGQDAGLYNVAIPASQIGVSDLSTCKVVNYVEYYNEDTDTTTIVPMEMETTVTTDENGNATGIVFTTGHFSNYAIMTTEAKKVVYGGGSSSGSSSSTSELEKAKTEAKADVKTEAEASKYDEAEAAEVKAIKEQAEKDIAAAKTVEEVKAIEAEAEAKIEAVLTTEEKAQVAAVTGVSKQVFKAKSKKAKLNGKNAVKVSWNLPDGMKVDGYEIYRSVKKNSGYGTKPYFTTTKTSYTNNKNLKAGKTYYYKVRAYILVNGEKVYTGWSTKAYRTI